MVVVAVGGQFDDQVLTGVAGTSLHLVKVSSLADLGSNMAALGQAVCAGEIENVKEVKVTFEI